MFKQKRLSLLLLLGFVMVLMQACAFFTTHYDATRQQNFTRLKAVHMKLLEDWTQGSGRSWHREELQSYCDRGDLSFREAFEYAKAQDKSDKTGQKAVKILWDEFSENCQSSLGKQALFNKVFIGELKKEIEKNYDLAIQGELSRVGAPD